MSEAMFAGIEAGGTKFVCAVGTSPDDILKITFPTAGPAETIERAAAFLRPYSVDAIGVGSFGPVDLREGRIGSTPKESWRDFDLVGALRRATGIELIRLDTDVNTAALGERIWGAAKGLHTFLYITVGTGIGGGGMAGGRLLHGDSHPEMGHVRVPHDWSLDPFPGHCYAHGDCLEGLASGPAMEARWKLRGEALAPDHPAWALEAHYLALALNNWICTLSPQRVILGGGVMSSLSLSAVREELRKLLNGYIRLPDLVPPALGGDAGVLGAIALARGEGQVG